MGEAKKITVRLGHAEEAIQSFREQPEKRLKFNGEDLLEDILQDYVQEVGFPADWFEVLKAEQRLSLYRKVLKITSSAGCPPPSPPNSTKGQGPTEQVPSQSIDDYYLEDVSESVQEEAQRPEYDNEPNPFNIGLHDPKTNRYFLVKAGYCRGTKCFISQDRLRQRQLLDYVDGNVTRLSCPDLFKHLVGLNASKVNEIRFQVVEDDLIDHDIAIGREYEDVDVEDENISVSSRIQSPDLDANPRTTHSYGRSRTTDSGRQIPRPILKAICDTYEILNNEGVG